MPSHPTCRALLILLGATSASLHRCSMAACVIAVNTLCVECITTSAPASTADRGTAETWVLPSVVSAPGACMSSYCAWGDVERPGLASAAVVGVPDAAFDLSCRPLAKGLRWPPCASSTSKGTPCLWQRSANSARAQQQSRQEGRQCFMLKAFRPCLVALASSSQVCRFEAQGWWVVPGSHLHVLPTHAQWAYLKLWPQLRSR